MKFTLRIMLGTFVLLASVPTFADESETSVGMELLPRGRLFRPTFADPREVRMGLNFAGDARINAAIANYFSIFAIKPVKDTSWESHFGLEGGGYFTMRHEEGRFPLETADGLIGLYFEGKSGPWQAQLRYTHISAHLADGSTASPIAYSRETLIQRVAYAPNFDLQIYGGVFYVVNTTPKVPPWALQFGGEYFLSLGTTKIVPFIATDLKWKQESNFNPSWNMELGFALNNPPEAYRSFRFFYSYYTGADPRGQFYNLSYTAHAVGIEMQI